MTFSSPNDLSSLLARYSSYDFTFPIQFPSPCNSPKCGRSLYSFEQLADHESHHATSAEALLSLSLRLTCVIGAHSSRKNTCYVCHNSFSSTQALRIHLNTQYVKAGIHECECGAKYADPSRKSRCAKSHTTVFRCPEPGCDYWNSRKELVVRHLTQGSTQSCHKRGTPANPIEAPRIDLNPPKYAPGREPAELRPCTHEVLDKLADMELMCKRYSCRRLAALAEHFLSLGMYDLAGAVNQKANSIRDTRGGSGPTFLRSPTLGDSRTPLGSDPIARDKPDHQCHPGEPPYFPIAHEGPRDGDAPQVCLTSLEESNPPIPVAEDPVDLVDEGTFHNAVDHSLTHQETIETSDLESLLALLQGYSSWGPLDVATSNVLIDIITNSYPYLYEGLGMNSFHGDPAAPANV